MFGFDITLLGAYYFRKSWAYFKEANELVKEYMEKDLPLDPVVVGLLKFGII